jgi:uncharacterized protein (TIGR02646 family)
LRPVLKGVSPIQGDFNNYRDAFDHLLQRISIGRLQGIQIAQYCSYCERPIPTNLAVEHIEPKNGAYAKSHLENRWSNFLLACVNCNSKKGAKEVDFRKLYFPDRDNTFRAFEYLSNGRIRPNPILALPQQTISQNTLDLLGLNDEINADVIGVSKDRRTQRLNVWLLALDSLEDFNNDPDNIVLKKFLVKEMLANGFFSIWMKVFESHPSVKELFINSITGTRASGCFDANSNMLSPHPNTDNLAHGSKI